MANIILNNKYYSASAITPTSKLAAVNIMLSGIGEAPVNSLSEMTSDVSTATNILTEVTKELQTIGFTWNTEDNYPLKADINGNIKVNPAIVRIHFREPDDRILVLRGNSIYDRENHTYTFDKDKVIYVTVTMLLEFEQMPEAARRYATIRALRVFQERIVGSSELSNFMRQDEQQAKALMLHEECKEDRPNMIRGTLPPTGTWRVSSALANRGYRRGSY